MSFLDLVHDRNRLSKIIEDLIRKYNDAKDDEKKFAYLDRLLKAQDIKQRVDATIRKNSLF